MSSFSRILLALLIAAVIPGQGRARGSIIGGPVTFLFKPSVTDGNPFNRDLRVEVISPSGKTLTLPAYFVGDGSFAVRVRTDEQGEYRRGKVTEQTGGKTVDITAMASGRLTETVAKIETLPTVRRDAADRSRFILSDGREYVPVGANLAWAPGGRLKFYRKAFEEFSRQGLNWTRVWMCHWGNLNLDWPSDRARKSLPLGSLDLSVASEWDSVIAGAEEHEVYVQLVLQHHGQYTTGANPNWIDNPWNVANGGFLATPDEFFTSSIARDLTKRKYRYIVARWGYSPAILSWELFNEVHWVDAIAKNNDVVAVAAWHAEMADYIRSIDVYGHLITTSTDDLNSPVYERMDYFQPHLYAPDMIASPQRLQEIPAQLNRPVFYGEIGEDHMRASERVKKSGLLIVPPVWASLMGSGRYPGQPWLGAELIATKRIGELGAVARFVAAMRAKPRGALVSFSPVIESSRRDPIVLTPGQHWRRGPQPVITIPVDGSYSSDVAELPQFIVGSPSSVDDGFQSRVTLHIDVPRDSAARLVIADGGAKGAELRALVDGRLVATENWPTLTLSSEAQAPKRPREMTLPLTAGHREIVLENTGGLDWVEFDSLHFDFTVPVVAAVGKRGADFAALWVWRRDGVFAEKVPAPVKDATVILGDVASGVWRVTWWDSLKGVPADTQSINHPGGALRLPIPPISRHAALILER
ncbi:MAG: DUF5060 domain-containing protein [Nibricoccus sp.]